MRNWKTTVLGERLTAKRLREMTPDDAAAYFVTHSDDLTPVEQKLLSVWLSANRGHARALKRAGAVWQWFDRVEENEVLAEMRAHALGARPKHWSRFLTASSRHRFCRYWHRKSLQRQHSAREDAR
jgi:ferric-dicitrate binding protein FerR (iron transport regulator)